MWRGISLANKCLLLFGAAVVLIILAALSVPWLRMNAIVDESQKELSRQLVLVWETKARTEITPPDALGDARVEVLASDRLAGLRSDAGTPTQRLAARAALLFGEKRDATELHEAAWLDLAVREYRYAKAVRDPASGSLTGVVVLTRQSRNAGAQLAVNTAYLVSAGLIALGLALLVFYLITSKLILQPVRELKTTAELVREGNWTTRSDIRTGDEFEELSDAFNQMLEAIHEAQEQLRTLNTQLDLRLSELAERNATLFEANQIKGEFLANVSHELRTPLNSIIGFAELLLELTQREEEAFRAAAAGNGSGGGVGGDEASRLQKRRRYLDNIHSAGKRLMEMINDLLEMAKVEAGKLELTVEPTSVKDACESLIALIRPLADRGGVELATEYSGDLPPVETDAKKFQQIVFNLLSNAVKFTAAKAADERASGQSPLARVTIRAERLFGRASQGSGSEDRVRVSVLDTGPGIAPEDQKKIFEKFQQLDTGLARRTEGTGLGLAIAKQFAHMLQGELLLDSQPGRGSMFSVIIPVRLDPDRARELKTDLTFRGRLVAQR
jgi:signal transduction histidine kinase